MRAAIALGMATATTDVGGDGEALRGAGIVIDPTKLQSQLTLALKIVLENHALRHSLGRSARRRVVSRYSLERNIDQVVRLYDRLLTTDD